MISSWGRLSNPIQEVPRRLEVFLCMARRKTIVSRRHIEEEES
jgi:hypothetical protein